MGMSDITIADFKAYHARGFDYYPGPPEEAEHFVTDADITKALTDATANFNESIFESQTVLQLAFLNLAAHFLCVDLQTAAQGVNSVGYSPVSSRGVGAVSESYQLPERLANSTTLSQYLTTRFGQKYLTIIAPRLVGAAISVHGVTKA